MKEKIIKTILLAMVGFDLTLHIFDYFKHPLITFPSWTFYEIFWISYCATAFVLLSVILFFKVDVNRIKKVV